MVYNSVLVPSTPNTAFDYFVVELCKHGPVLVHIRRREMGGDIDTVDCIDESTWGVLCFPFFRVLIQRYVKRSKLQTIHTIYIIPSIWYYSYFFIQYQQFRKNQNTLRLDPLDIKIRLYGNL